MRRRVSLDVLDDESPFRHASQEVEGAAAVASKGDTGGGMGGGGKGDGMEGGKGGWSGLAFLVQKILMPSTKGETRIFVNRIFVPPKAPPPPTVWATIKNEHLLVAAFWPTDTNYAKARRGRSPLRPTQLVQIFFNTLMFQLGLVTLLAWRFTDFETGLSGPMILLAALVTAFVSAPFTLLCKGTFRWGNTRRRKVREGSRLRRLSQWLRSAFKAEGGVRVALMRQWWHHRTASLHRTPETALTRVAVMVRGHLSWCLIFAAYFGAMALVLVFGLNFEDIKYHSVLAGE